MRGLLALVLGAWVALPAAADPCESVAFDGADFTVCRIDVARDDLRLFRADADGNPYGSFRALDRALAQRGERLGVAMNGGMYHPDRAPVGLYVEDHVEGAGIVTREGPGNFGLLPNGVFCVQQGRAAVIESRAFAADPPDCAYATQSGPMLVLGGALHPRFLEDGTSLYRRNGVGVSADGSTVYLAISDEPVNFHHFARLFRDALDVPDALFLDGNISRLYSRGDGRHDGGWPMGPILGTVEPLDGAG
ncbi:hypothetical protein OCGS_1765 [Oceaniovalibus guishaninsula JLT2003]|uniref:Phosphodiester glycosidase domain-containing protein n=2 Tax=Oceaniovalibus TaxID=1207070 RepID=K2HN28_9RHOB|nr:hypothetical protein OCGS_1765 [Oceaniovalibus guishaninsula JLT2003]